MALLLIPGFAGIAYGDDQNKRETDMANLALKRPENRREVSTGADQNAVYKVAAKEMKNLQRVVESPSGSWTLIKERTRATKEESYKQR